MTFEWLWNNVLVYVQFFLHGVIAASLVILWRR